MRPFCTPCAAQVSELCGDDDVLCEPPPTASSVLAKAWAHVVQAADPWPRPVLKTLKARDPRNPMAVAVAAPRGAAKKRALRSRVKTRA